MLQKFAEDLKSLRKSKNLSLTEMSASTKISQTSFQKIENGDFTFQPETYIRAFIKQYAIALDLDPDEVIKDYDLAKAGKYTSKFASEEKPAEKSTEKTETGAALNKETVTEKREEPKEIKRPPAQENLKPKEKPKETPKEKPAEKQFDKHKEKQGGYPYNYASERKGEGSGMGSSALKTIGTIVVLLLICAGLYFLVTTLFLNGKKDKVEVQRQNFDEVVKENEKKILGKRTEEEIQDSIRKAEEEQRRLLESMPQDTLNLTITSTARGSLTIVADSVNISKPETVQFGRNEIGEWKARKFFIISSPNTSAFIAKVNGKKIDFPDKVADKVRVGRDGIIK